MAVATLLSRPGLAVLDYHCTLGPGDTPFVERYENHSVAFVRRGSFGCRSRGRDFELVAGSVLVGYPGDEYLCTHDHAGAVSRRLPSAERVTSGASSSTRSQSLHVTCLCF